MYLQQMERKNMKQKKALLVISFGTSHKDTRTRTIEAIEEDLKKEFPDRVFYRAWTSAFLRKKVRQEGYEVCSVQQALETICNDGISDLLVQPTHMLCGKEHEDARREILTFQDCFSRLSIGRPLMADREDVRVFANTLESLIPVSAEQEVVAWMGHGSPRSKLNVYDLLNRQFLKDAHPEICVGTVEWEPGIAPVLDQIRLRKPRRVILAPMLVVAGDHAKNDMAGDDPDSWKNQIAAEHTEVECLVKGLGEYPEVRKLYLDHARCPELIVPGK